MKVEIEFPYIYGRYSEVEDYIRAVLTIKDSTAFCSECDGGVEIDYPGFSKNLNTHDFKLTIKD